MFLSKVTNLRSPSELNRASIGLHLAGQNAQKGGLADPIAPDHGDLLAAINSKVNAFEHDVGTVRFMDAGYIQEHGLIVAGHSHRPTNFRLRLRRIRLR